MVPHIAYSHRTRHWRQQPEPCNVVEHAIGLIVAMRALVVRFPRVAQSARAVDNHAVTQACTQLTDTRLALPLIKLKCRLQLRVRLRAPAAAIVPCAGGSDP